MNTGQVIRGVVFDVDGTLYRQLPLRMVMGSLLVLSNLRRPLELARTLKVVTAYRRAQEILRRDPVKVRNPALRQLEMAADASGESSLFVRSVIEKWFVKIPAKFLALFKRHKLLTVLDDLFSVGIKLGVYSDYPVHSKLKALGISHYITVALSAADERVIGFKPRSNGFELVSMLLDLKPKEILYVGDRTDIDGAGAAAAGMQVAIISGRTGSLNGPYPVITSLNQIIDLVRGKIDRGPAGS